MSLDWDIWSVKAVDLGKSLADMNFRLIIMRAKNRLSDQTGTSLQL